MSISDDPTIIEEGWLSQHDIRLVRAWILLNRDVLLRHWNRSLPTVDMMAALRPLGLPRGQKWARRHDRQMGENEPAFTLAATIMKKHSQSHHA
jgi:ligand-binding SRPBCC domain-containing protein